MRGDRTSRSPKGAFFVGGRVTALLVLLACLPNILPAHAAAADAEWPTLSPGQWQFTRMMEVGGKETTIERTACVDPVAEWKKQRETWARSGCRVTTARTGPDRFLTTAVCDIPGVGKGTSRSTAIVEDPGSYQVTVENEGVVAQTGAREQLLAKRLGACSK